jgi:hypothetical protein
MLGAVVMGTTKPYSSISTALPEDFAPSICPSLDTMGPQPHRPHPHPSVENFKLMG